LACLVYDSCGADLHAHTRKKGAVWTDEFTTRNSRWEWSYNAGTGYKRLTTVDGVSVVEAGITSGSSSSSYSDCSLHETSHRYTYAVFEARLRCTDNDGQGTRGWGFWHWEEDNPLRVSAAWFWDASPESDASVVGFQVMVARDATIVFQKLLPEIDIREWHVYRVELLPTGTRFFVDSSEVAFAFNQRPNRLQRIEMWTDNYRVQVTNGKVQPAGYLNVQQDQKMYIDWVKYYEEPDTVPPGPVNNLKIKEISVIEPLPITFTPVADTYVNNNPSNNYGFEATLQAGG
jgi:hypothetical protein